MYRSRRSLLAFLVGVLALAGAPAALAVEAGITLDVHQDIYDQALWPNDFHVEGLICSHGGVAPILLNHIDGPFPFFTYTVEKIPGEECWYWFEATWWAPQGQYIPYCTVIHLGLLFDVEASNVIIDLVGWWTRDGMPVGDLIGNLNNSGYTPLIGFNVQDTGSPQTITIGNGDIPITPPLPPPLPPLPPWPPDPIPLWILQMDVIPFPPGPAPDFHELSEFGEQQFWAWIPVVYPDGVPINPGRPQFTPPQSFFDVFIDIPTPTGLRPAAPFVIPPGGFLVSRQLVGFYNNFGQPETRWFWEIHGAQQTEACCFTDGHCEDLLPFTCLQKGGQPMGSGSNCANTICPGANLGACCFGTGNPQCIVTDQITCQQQFAGQWKGPGTDCTDADGDGVADICEPLVLGACCYGTTAPLCAVTDEITCTQQLMGQWKGPGTDCTDADGDGVADICEQSSVLGACCYGATAPLCAVTDEITCVQQLMGQWKGPGTDCTDADGDGVADICEPPQQPEGCCLPDGTCVMLLPADCLNMGGTPKGPYSRCLGDLNGNGTDDLCDAKWLQMPDLSTNGIDVDATVPLVLADDFQCTERGAITDIIVWGSWYHDMLPGDPMNVVFTLSFHEDIPQGPNGYSMPGAPVWWHVFPPGSFIAIPFQTGILEGWYNPAQNYFEFPGDTVCWQYYFHVPPELAFCQKGSTSNPKVYWLDVQAQPQSGPADVRFGWKTSPQHWNDDAVWGIGPEPYPGPWYELLYPPQHPLYGESIDLAFALGSESKCYCKGDLNCDGVVDFGDINPFVLRLSNLAGYKALYPDCPDANGDIDGNGVVGFGDINPFVALLTGAPIPCP